MYAYVILLCTWTYVLCVKYEILRPQVYKHRPHTHTHTHTHTHIYIYIYIYIS